jgi:prophage antirepressor-like protein
MRSVPRGTGRSVAERLDSDEKGVSSIHTPGGLQSVSVINESGLYSLILGSRKPEAKKFKKWVTSEVLPAIRKTGAYRQPGTERHMHCCGQMAHSVVGPVQQALFDAFIQARPGRTSLHACLHHLWP